MPDDNRAPEAQSGNQSGAPSGFTSGSGAEDRDVRRTLARLRPRIANLFVDRPDLRPVFEARMDVHFPRLFQTLRHLYGHQYDFFWHLEQIVATAARQMISRSASLHAADLAAEASPDWFRSHWEIGAVCYVDQWAGTLRDIPSRLDHLKSLGVTYLHLMPLLKTRPAPNDGGYAVSDYREVDPRFGTMADLADLADTLRGEGIRLCLDMVFNHTADDHRWAQDAIAGDDEKRDYYLTYPDRTGPDQYQPHLREIFPDRGSENFLWVSSLNRYVWSTFYPFQWDLNFANPALFTQMLDEMLFLANKGISILRLDAVPFVWKEAGTPCENLPDAHAVVQALNAAVRLAAPSLVFKSEAIVHPDDVVSYVSANEAQMSYNPLLMVLLWEALATRDTTLMRHSLIKRFALPQGTGWVNYIRCHDDIGWGFADEDCREIGIDPHDHRQFLNAFYTGRFPGSFSRGLPFQDNPRTGDCRICGMTASLTGLETALAAFEAGSAGGNEVELAVRRIIMMHAIIMTVGGVPLLYLGDEVARQNDYSYLQDPDKASDARWVQRPTMDWSLPALRPDGASSTDKADPPTEKDRAEVRVLSAIRRLSALRKSSDAFSQSDIIVLPLENRHLLGILKRGSSGPVVLIANFSEHPQPLNDWGLPGALGTEDFHDLWTGEAISFGGGMVIDAHAFHCLTGAV